jgi:histidinol-phosphatase
MSMHELLQAVATVARVAGDVAHSMYFTGIESESKADGSPVTAADRAAERVAREWIEERFPHDCIIGEEFGVTREGAARRWVMDPIDGTKAFMRGVPLWGTLVAICEGPDVLAGCAYFPAAGEIVCAARGEGTWWNDSKCRVSNVSDLSRAVLLTTDIRIHDESLRDRWMQLVGSAAVGRTWGDCYGYLLIATGRAEAMLDPVMNEWDAAAVMPIIEEAGGVFTDLLGQRTSTGGSVVATNAAL